MKYIHPLRLAALLLSLVAHAAAAADMQMPRTEPMAVEAAGKLTLPFDVCGQRAFKRGRHAQMTVGTTLADVYELVGVADSGAVCDLPQVNALLFDNATIDYPNLNFVVKSMESTPLTIMVRGHNDITCINTAVCSTGALIVNDINFFF